MVLSETAEQALRTMACVAALPPGTRIGAAELASRSGVPAASSRRVVRRLVAGGLLHARGGRGGGYALGRPASEVRFADVIRAVGAMPDRSRCCFRWGACIASSPCPLHSRWALMLRQFEVWTERTTLAALRAGGPAGGPTRSAGPPD